MKNRIESIVRFLHILLLSLIIQAIPEIVFAQEQKKPTNTSYAGCGALILFLICYSKRKKPIGGWLLYFFIQFYLGAFFTTIFSIIGLTTYVPSQWESMSLYAIFLFTTIGSVIIAIMEVGLIAIKMVPEKYREWKAVKLLRILLSIDLLLSIISLLTSSNFSENVLVIYGMIFPIIAILYFSFSKRVKALYLSKDIDAWLNPKASTTVTDPGGDWA